MTDVLKVPVKMRYFFAAIFACTVVFSCVNPVSEKQFEPVAFPSVKVPSLIQGGPMSYSYLAEHFWDNFVDTSRMSFPTDSLYVGGVKRAEVEQNIANYIAIADRIPREESEKYISNLTVRLLDYERADTSSIFFETMSEILIRYLYDPNSPLRNEDLYHGMAVVLSGYEGFSDAHRLKYSYDAKMTGLNAVGTEATDFAFSDRNGNVRNLSSIRADYTVLFFSNPGCNACMDIISALNNPAVKDAVSSGRLAVLNMYIDEDIVQWYEYMSVYPEYWYNGYDPNFVIRDGSLYNIRAIPSLYVLDSDKVVMMKDAPLENVLSFLENIVFSVE